MSTRRLVLASASPARRRLLDEAGFGAEVIVSGVDEDDTTSVEPAAVALELAVRKAEAVAAMPEASDALVLGCDSVLDVAGVIHGKPANDEEAMQRLTALRGHSAVLRTGHCVIDTRTSRRASGVEATTVRFGDYHDDELAAYIATGEALEVAGAFTLLGRSAPFVEGIDGDASNVIGLSLPLFRRLLAVLDVTVMELWT